LPTCFNGRIFNNLIVGNRAEQPNAFIGEGGGIYCLVSQTPLGDHLDDVLILNNTIVGNTADDRLFFQGGWGGAMALDILEERLVIGNNIIAFNSSGIWKQQVNPKVPVLIKNDLFDNPLGPGTDYNYVTLSPGPTDISLDPLFVNQPDGEYRLQSDSPCIDSASGTIVGLPTTDIDGNTRPKDGNYDGVASMDMGAYEFSQCVGNFEGDDGDVDGSDLARWMIDPRGVSLQTFASCFGRDDCR
jgi:hypothetical protein